jgi:hypothetical protein
MASTLWKAGADALVGSPDISRRTVLTGAAAGLAAANVPCIARAAPQGQLT